VRRAVGSGSPFEDTIGFSRAVRVGDVVAVAATASIWPDGWVDDDVAAQARRCLELIEEALAGVEARLDDVVRTRVFLVSADDAGAVAAVHAERFGAIRPVTGFIVVRGFIDPRWRVEIEADAIVAGGATSQD
jgi:enamine deaminase RidA (YjgF/YER057c/UK114 family)